MTKSELISYVSKTTQLPAADVDSVICTTLDSIMNKLSSGEKVTLSGFGRFEMRERAPKTYVNPRTKEVRTLEQGQTPGFKPSGIMKKRTVKKT